jgi:F-type H+-transporting ATPase subunit b
MFEAQTGLIFWSAVSFVILLFLLYKIVFPPLNKALEQRRKEIKGGLEQAQNAQEQANQLLKKYQDRLDEAENRTNLMFEDAQRKSQALRDETLKAAEREAVAVIENAKKDIEGLKRKALVSLKEDISTVVVDVTRRLIGKSLGVKDHLKLIESSIEELEKNAETKI